MKNKSKILSNAGELCEEIRNRDLWNEHCEKDDFGDIAPFMVWYDKITGNKENIEWCKKIVPEPLYKPTNATDLLLGYNLMHILTEDKEYMYKAVKTYNNIIENKLSRKGFVYGSKPISWGSLRHKPHISGLTAEEMQNLWKITKDEKYKRAAGIMMDAWLRTPTFRKSGICCDNVYLYINREASNTCTLGKTNTNFSYALLALHKATGKYRYACTKNLHGLDAFRRPDNAFCRCIDKTGKSNTVEIAQNHMAIAVYLDAYELFGLESFLETAKSCMDYWIEKGIRGNPDEVGDMLTMLCRLNMAGGGFDKEISETVKMLMKMKLPKTTKFIGGMLKGLLTSYTILNNDKSVDKKTFNLLMRDR